MLLRAFGRRADGLWLTERVWEPDLSATVARAGLRYTIVDVNQFEAAKPWLPSDLQLEDGTFWDVFGSYTTDSPGASIRVFPSSARLRDLVARFFRVWRGG